MMNLQNSDFNIRILFFAKARELAGVSESLYQISTHNITSNDLLENICSTYNLQLIRNNIILAINEEYCDNPQEELYIQEGDEVAIIPPISGG